MTVSTALRRFLLIRLRWLVPAFMVVPLLSLVAPWSGLLPAPLAWGMDLLVHWQWLALAVLLPAGLLLVWLERYWWPALLVLPLPWLMAQPGEAEAVQANPVLAVASANVHHANSDAGLLLAWVRQVQPDILVLMEVSPAFADQLQQLEGYPYRQIVPQEDPFGIALLSRLPLGAVRVTKDTWQIPRIEAEVRVNGRAVMLFAEHPMPPLNPVFYTERDQKIEKRAAFIQGKGQAGILLGDLNATVWSSALQGVRARGLRRASPLAPSWPALAGPMGRALPGIPIDNILVSSEFGVVSQIRGPWIGSDHYPVMVQLAWHKT